MRKKENLNGIKVNFPQTFHLTNDILRRMNILELHFECKE
jgi:hypothetical protein